MTGDPLSLLSPLSSSPFDVGCSDVPVFDVPPQISRGSPSQRCRTVLAATNLRPPTSNPQPPTTNLRISTSLPSPDRDVSRNVFPGSPASSPGPHISGAGRRGPARHHSSASTKSPIELRMMNNSRCSLTNTRSSSNRTWSCWTSSSVSAQARRSCTSSAMWPPTANSITLTDSQAGMSVRLAMFVKLFCQTRWSSENPLGVGQWTRWLPVRIHVL